MIKILLIVSLVFHAAASRAENEQLAPCGLETSSEITVVKRIPPRYPRINTMEYAEGWVKLQVKVDSNGKIVELIIMDAKPKRVFERSAKKTIKHWEFSKSTSQQSRCGVINLEFSLEE
jgi:TonB family protein